MRKWEGELGSGKGEGRRIGVRGQGEAWREGWNGGGTSGFGMFSSLFPMHFPYPPSSCPVLLLLFPSPFSLPHLPSSSSFSSPFSPHDPLATPTSSLIPLLPSRSPYPFSLPLHLLLCSSWLIKKNPILTLFNFNNKFSLAKNPLWAAEGEKAALKCREIF